MTDLKPCPFCGGEATLVEDIYDDRLCSYVICSNDNCNANTGRYDTEDEAITKWNTRPNPWHTGTPTENGYYLCHFKSGDSFHDICLEYKDAWDLGEYNINPYTFEVIAWQMIEPYKEAGE